MYVYKYVTYAVSVFKIVFAQVNVKPEASKQSPRNIPYYKKAEKGQPKHYTRDIHTKLKQFGLATTNVQSIWDNFASIRQQDIDKFIPTRKTCIRWIFII